MLGTVVVFILITAIAVVTTISYNNKINSTLIEDYEEYYNVVKEGLYNYDSTIVIKVKNFDESVYNLDVVHKILEDNLELSGNFDDFKFQTKNLKYATEITFIFEYLESRDVIVNRENAVKSKIEDIISQVIKPEMKDYEKEKVLHDYIINNCKFDERYDLGNMPSESYTAYGVLINGTGVCQGYAIAMDKLLKAVGMESTIVVGSALNDEGNDYISHAWNIVKIGGQYYHLDLTWDDPIMEDGSDKLGYSYFNITDEQIQLNHKWDKNNYPNCINTEYSFSNLGFAEKDLNGNDIIVVKDYDEFYSYIKEDISKVESDKTYKSINFDGDEEKIEGLIIRAYESLSKEGEYSYSIESDEITKYCYITVTSK